MRTLLSVDWDYFFPNPNEAGSSKPGDLVLFDWGHREAPLFESSMMWHLRASGFLRAGRDLPRTSGDEIGWWERFRFADDAELWIAESHAMAAFVATRLRADAIWNYDAHHDCGYGPLHPDAFDCSDWIRSVRVWIDPDVHVRYPRWVVHPSAQQSAPDWADARIDDPDELLPAFDAAFVCRSPAWVPTWCDDAFTAFVAACPLPVRVVTRRGRPTPDPRLPRGFNLDTARAYAAQTDAAMGGAA